MLIKRPFLGDVLRIPTVLVVIELLLPGRQALLAVAILPLVLHDHAVAVVILIVVVHLLVLLVRGVQRLEVPTTLVAVLRLISVMLRTLRFLNISNNAVILFQKGGAH